MSTIALKRTSIKTKIITAILAIVSAVLLPQLFHVVGAVSGVGNALGAAFLPMHIPVLLAGLMGGPVAGAIAGAVSPVISFALSGMPGAAVLPFMAIELMVYGAAGGFMSKAKMPVFAKLVITQAAGRVVRALAVLAAVYIFGSQSIQVASIWNMAVDGLAGILLQWAFIPLLMYRMEGLKKYYE